MRDFRPESRGRVIGVRGHRTPRRGSDSQSLGFKGFRVRVVQFANFQLGKFQFCATSRPVPWHSLSRAGSAAASGGGRRAPRRRRPTYDTGS
eukprot:62954-Hanusia_phi.AAC.1